MSTAATAPVVRTTHQPGDALPQGFTFSGVRCGIKPGRSDLALLLCSPAAVAAGVFTKNPMRAACCDRNATLVPSGNVAAVIVNSGNANAMTGAQGASNNAKVAAELGKLLGCAPERVLTASTGVIGTQLPVDLVVEALDPLIAAHGDDPRGFAEAILTTDTVTKFAAVELQLPGADVPVRLFGVAKGSGMIHPNMATTLGFVCTDAAVPPALLQSLLGQAIQTTFNAISVDGDTSTNDMVLVLANGASGVHVEDDAKVAAFSAGLHGVLRELAKQVARDGEGATRLLEVEVTGAPDVASAAAIARTVAKSSLVKCSVFAGQPNWGRIAMAVGQAAIEHGGAVTPATLRIAAGGHVLFDGDRDGRGSAHLPAELKRALRSGEVAWSIDLGIGDASFTAWGCDMTYDYVRINADDAKGIAVASNGTVSRSLSLSAYSPRLKQQLLVEGLGYVRRFTGLKLMVYLQPAARGRGESIDGLAQDLELCLDAGLKPLVIVPDKEAAARIEALTHRAATSRPWSRPIRCRSARCSIAATSASSCARARRPTPWSSSRSRSASTSWSRWAPRRACATPTAPCSGSRPRPCWPASSAAASTTAIPICWCSRATPRPAACPRCILDARMPHAVVGELFTDDGVGTLVTRQALA
ncbi:MAG: bifunctional glutamate N-acetyltransferase/amino-acid acetyltransferase ArgJ [Deltaproteobacteria bacterium]|nr:bifunctional glutamate N-acetyltransferase/amino-acid acetyltransferase ArgJ [Deltaproteobacteria bacterium]